MFNIENSKNINKDIPQGMNLIQAHQYYLDLYGNFESILAKPKVILNCAELDFVGGNILDFSTSECGFKAHAAEKLIASINRPMAYVAPRVGHAAEAIAYLCEKYEKEVVFFAPGSAEVSKHQAVVLAYKGSQLRFVRTPAMPTINHWVKKWCKQHNYEYLPFGLTNSPMVTAGIVKLCADFVKDYRKPYEVFCAVSTGTMIRGLEIGFKNSFTRGIAVARNIKEGETGFAKIVSYDLPFLKPGRVLPKTFKTTSTYDAKAFEIFKLFGSENSLFVNVGSDEQIEKRLKDLPIQMCDIDSKREWGDLSDFDRGI